MPRCDAVFEGGGVKGIGLVGAVSVTEEMGYDFCTVAGTSAGAIVAALVAAGYRASELRDIMRSLDYTQFKDAGLLDNIPVFGRVLSLGLEKGIYEGAYLEDWLREKLAAKGKRTFKDLIIDEFRDAPKYRYKLQVIATEECFRTWDSERYKAAFRQATEQNRRDAILTAAVARHGGLDHRTNPAVT